MNTEAETTQIAKALRTVTHAAEELIKATAGEVGEKARDARVRLTAALETAGQTCRQWEQKALEGAKVTDKVVHEHPYQTMGVAFAVGMLFGVLIRRK